MTALIAIAVLLLGPERAITIDQVDLIEHNHYYDEQSRHVFDQLIFYDWSPRESRYQIRDWRLIKTPTQVPVKDGSRGLHVTTWHDGQLLRQVRAVSVRESWLQWDPELVERVNLPKERRRELSTGRRTIREANVGSH